MDSGSDGDSEARFSAYVEQLGTALGHAGRSTGTVARLLPGPVDADRAQERGADGGGDRAGASSSKASISASLCRQRAVVGRGDAGQGERFGVAGD